MHPSAVFESSGIKRRRLATAIGACVAAAILVAFSAAATSPTTRACPSASVVNATLGLHGGAPVATTTPYSKTCTYPGKGDDRLDEDHIPDGHRLDVRRRREGRRRRSSRPASSRSSIWVRRHGRPARDPFTFSTATSRSRSSHCLRRPPSWRSWPASYSDATRSAKARGIGERKWRPPQQRSGVRTLIARVRANAP